MCNSDSGFVESESYEMLKSHDGSGSGIESKVESKSELIEGDILKGGTGIGSNSIPVSLELHSIEMDFCPNCTPLIMTNECKNDSLMYNFYNAGLLVFNELSFRGSITDFYLLPFHYIRAFD